MSLLIPKSFSTKTGSVQLSDLDTNFTYLTNTVNTALDITGTAVTGYGNTTVYGTLGASGAVTLASTLDVTGVATLRSALSTIPTGGRLSGTDVGSIRAPGLVLQVTWTNWNGVYTGASASNVDFTGFSTTFTPLYSTSKVLIIVSAGVNFICDGAVYIKRNGTIVKDNWFGSSRVDDQYDYPQAAQTYLDSPATTSTITYQMGGRATGCGNVIRFGASDNSSSICLMEIAA